jgi:hypothetical protein
MGKKVQNQWILVKLFMWAVTVSFPISPSSWALQGQYLKKDKIPDSVCVVKVYDGICTGTLISKDIVITAAHCIDKDHIRLPKKKLPIFVSCKKNSSIRASAMVYPSKDLNESSSYHTKDEASELDENGQPNNELRKKWKYDNADVALLKLSKAPKKISHQELILSEEEAVAVLETAVLCGYYGAGEDNRKETGRVRGIDYQDFKTDLTPNQMLTQTNGHFFTVGKTQGIRPGDSGGPLSCLDKEGKWSMLSVHQNLNITKNYTGRSRASFKDESWLINNLQNFQ